MDFRILSEHILAAGSRSLRAARDLLEEKAPQIAGQICEDSRRKGPLSFWGRSRNLDELAGLVIVEPTIIHLIASLSGRPLSLLTPHAGLQHTYGYLFSTIETPYGFKRERWTKTDIEVAFGLDRTTLSPFPERGTLLANATWFSGQFAFRGHAANRHRLRDYLEQKVSPDLLQLRAGKGRHVRLSERVDLVWRKDSRAWTLQTDLVSSAIDSRFGVLIYSVVDHQHEEHQLITMFPVGAAVRKQLRDRARRNRRTDIRPRYNAYIAALNAGEFSGSCRLRTF